VSSIKRDSTPPPQWHLVESARLLPLPRHFEQLAQLVTEDMVSAPCGLDPEPHIKVVWAYQEAGFDEVYLGQAGGRLEGAFDFLAAQVLPRVREPDLSRCGVLL